MRNHLKSRASDCRAAATAPLRFLQALAALAALLALFETAAAADLRVGIASAVTPSAVGAPPSGAAQTLVLGADILFKERINTDPAGKAQIIFLDHSSLSIAPNSALVIDEFVYDPARSAGSLALSTSKGLLRYIGGKISKGSDVTFTTPVAVIAIRGGMLMVKVELSGRTTATFLYGEHMILSAGGVSETVTRPGYQVIVEAAGRAPSSPTRASQATIDAALASFEGGGQRASAADGGASSDGVVLGDQTAEATAGGSQIDPESIITAAAGTNLAASSGAVSGASTSSLGLVVSDASITDEHIITILNSSPLPVAAMIPGSTATGSVGAATSAATRTATTTTTAVGSTLSATTATVGATVAGLGSTVSGVGSTVSGLGSTVANVTAALAPVIGGVGSLVANVGSTVSNLSPTVANLGTTVASVTSALPAVTTPATSTLASAVSALTSATGGAGTTSASTAAGTTSAVSPLTSAVANAATSLTSTASTASQPTTAKTASVLTKSLTQAVKLP